MTPKEIIKQATLQAFPYVSDHATATAVLLSSLSSLDEQVVQLIAQVQPEMLSLQQAEMSVTDGKNKSGYSLKDSPIYRDFKLITASGDAKKISVVQREDIDRAGSHPAGAVVATLSAGRKEFIPADPRQQRWSTAGSRTYFKVGEKITYQYIPQTVQLVTLTDTLASPVSARPYLIAALSLDIILAHEQAPPERIDAAAQRVEIARSTMVMTIHKFVMPSPQPSTTYT